MLTEALQQIQDQRFRCYRNETNIGYANIMESVCRASGKYALVLNDKDNIDPNGLAELIKVLNQIKDAVIVYGNYKGGKVEGVYRPNYRYPFPKVVEAETIVSCLMRSGYCSGIVYNVSVARKVMTRVDKSKIIWSLYPFRYAEVLMCHYGKTICLNKWLIYYKRNGERDVEGATNLKCDAKNMFWTVYSRNESLYEWADVYCSNFSKSLIRKSMPSFMISVFLSLREYYDEMRTERAAKTVKNYEELKALYEIDLKRNRVYWWKYELKVYKEVCDKLIRKIYGNRLKYMVCMEELLDVVYISFFLHRVLYW